jgi:hypothetical protein
MKKKHLPGSITVRSNVAMQPKSGRDLWDLVPGELRHGLGRGRKATRLQNLEHMYYQPCAICRRTIAEINMTGCSECEHAPASAQVLGAQERHWEQVAAARHLEAEENERYAGSIVVHASGIVYGAEEAGEPTNDQPAISNDSPRPSDTTASGSQGCTR